MAGKVGPMSCLSLKRALTVLACLFLLACSQVPEEPSPELMEQERVRAYFTVSDQEYATFHKSLVQFLESIPKLEAVTDRASPEALAKLELDGKAFAKLADDYQTGLENRLVPAPLQEYHKLEIQRLGLLREIAHLEFKRQYVGNPFHRDYFAARDANETESKKVQAGLETQRERLFKKYSL